MKRLSLNLEVHFSTMVSALIQIYIKIEHPTLTDNTCSTSEPDNPKFAKENRTVNESPSPNAIAKAAVLDVRFVLDFSVVPEMNSPEAYCAWGRSGGQAPWAEVLGLRSKYFTLNEETHEAGGFYTFFNKQALDNYMASDLFKSMGTFPFITELTYKTFEVIPGTELTMDLGEWN
jgi:hypothetical protein